MRSMQRLTDEQEKQRIEGLRILARIIARHYIAHPELYSQGVAEERSLSPGSEQAREGAT